MLLSFAAELHYGNCCFCSSVHCQNCWQPKAWGKWPRMTRNKWGKLCGQEPMSETETVDINFPPLPIESQVLLNLICMLEPCKDIVGTTWYKWFIHSILRSFLFEMLWLRKDSFFPSFCVLRGYSWLCLEELYLKVLGDHMDRWGSNSGQLQQKPFLLYRSSSSLHFFI